MDIITHTISGIAVGTVLAAFAHKTNTSKTAIIILSALGALLPDLDAISLWSKFDIFIGNPLKLSHSGKEIYFSRFWYSHHAFLHSISAPIIIAAIFGLLFFTIKQQFQPKPWLQALKQHYNKRKLLYTAFILGFLIHLFQDMITPASVWGGVNFLWPSKNYTGGTGHIWWWNNYDLFLVVLSVIVCNIIALTLYRYLQKSIGIITLIIFTMGVSLFAIQVKTRQYNYAYAKHTPHYWQYEQQSKAEQKRILGNTLYSLMHTLDNNIPLNF